MRLNTYIILAFFTCFFVQLNGQCWEYEDPFIDYQNPNICCGYDLDTINVCYDLQDWIDYKGYPSDTAKHRIKTLEHDSLGLILLEKDFSSFDDLAGILNSYFAAQGIAGIYFSYDPSNERICSEDNFPIFDRISLCAKPCDGTLTSAEFYVPAYTTGCPFTVPDISGIIDVTDETQLPNITIFGTDENPTITTNDIANSDSPSDIGPSPNQMAYLFNQAKMNNLLGGSCIDIDCYDYSGVADEILEDIPDWYYDDVVFEEGQELPSPYTDNQEFLEDEVPAFIDNFDLAAFLNEQLGMNLVSDGICDGELISLPFGGQNGGNNKSVQVPETTADQDLFHNENMDQNSDFSTPKAAQTNAKDVLSGSVDQYNGKANANINIYNLQSRDLSVPISINSSSNGLKINDIGSDVGQQWNLAISDYINRQVNGLPDEFIGQVRSMSPEFEKTPTLRVEFPSHIGFLVGHTSLNGICGSSECKAYENLNWDVLYEGISHCETIGEIQVRLAYSLFSPNKASLVLSFQIPLGPSGFYLRIQVGFTIGIVLNEIPVYKERLTDVVGYNHIINQASMETIGLDAINDINNLESILTKEKYLNRISSKSRRSELSFLANQAASFNEYLEAIFGANLIPNQQRLDIEPDLYSFSVGGRSGTFYINHDETIVCDPPQPDLIIEPFYCDENLGAICSFQFTTGDGKIYTMGSASGETGVDESKFNSYSLSNFYTFPEQANESLKNSSANISRYYKPQIDISMTRFFPPVGPTTRETYGATYDRNFQVNEGVSFYSKWQVTTIKSLLTNEQVDFVYEFQNGLEFAVDKNLSYAFPNFSSGFNESLISEKNTDLNPLRLGNTKWQNGRAEFGYNYTEQILNKNRLKSIQTSTGDRVEIEYNIEKVEIFNDKLVSDIILKRNGNKYKGWHFNYGVYTSGASETGCSEEPVNPLVVVPPLSDANEFKFDLGKLYTLKWHEYNSYLFLRLGIPCLNTNIPIPIPTLLPTTHHGHFAEMTEMGSIGLIKRFVDDLIPYDEDHYKSIYIREKSRSFLENIEYSGKSEERYPFVDLQYNGDLTSIPKRFSLNQDKYGYYFDNSEHGYPFFDFRYKTILGKVEASGEFNSNTGVGIENLFGFSNKQSETHQVAHGRAFSDNVEELRMGSIAKIQSENGSFTEFFYEKNILDEKISEGVRVKAIHEKPDGSPGLINEFTYENPTVNIPILNHKQEGYYLRYWNNLAIPVPAPLAPLESKVLIASSSLNTPYMNAGAYIGYEKVKMESPDGYHVNTYSVPSPFHYPQYNADCGCDNLDFYRAAAYSPAYSIQDDSDWTQDDIKLCRGMKPHLLGSLLKNETFNAADELTSDVIYTYETISTDEEIELASISKEERYNNGSFEENVQYNNLDFYMAFDESKWANLINLIINLVEAYLTGVVLDHPFKKIERYFDVSHINYKGESKRLMNVISTEHFDSESITSTTDYSYLNPNDTRISSEVNTIVSSTNPSVPHTISNHYHYASQIFADKSKFEQSYLDHINSFDASFPIVSETIQDGTLVSKAFRTYVLKSENIVAPDKEYRTMNGDLRYSGKYITNDNGTVSQYWLAKYGTTESAPLVANSTHYFDPIEYTWHGVNPSIPVSKKYAEAIETYVYEPSFYELDKITDRNGLETSFSYDNRGLLQSKTSEFGRIVEIYTYNIEPGNNYVYQRTEFNPLAGETASAPQAQFQFMDGYGRPLRVLRENDNRILQSTSYDAYGRTKNQYNLGSGTTEYSYEKSLAPRFSSIVDTENNITEMTELGPIGNYFSQTVSKDPNNHISKSFKDYQGRVVETTSGEGGGTINSFDAYNRLIQMNQKGGGAFIYHYNKIDKPYKVEIPNADPKYIWWDKSFRPVISKDGNGNVIYSQYDQYNRMKSQNTGSISGQSTVNIIDTPTAQYVESGDALLTLQQYDGEKDWLIASTEKVLTASGANQFMNKVNVYPATNNTGRPYQTITTTPFGSIQNNLLYTAAGNIKSNTANYTWSGDTKEIIEHFEYDQLLRPSEHFLDLDGEQRTLNQIVYNTNDQVRSKYIGGVSENQFLQRVDYVYDGIGRLIHINTPGTSNCSSTNAFCDFEVKVQLQNPPLKSDCYMITGIVVNGHDYLFTDPFDIRYFGNQIELQIEAILEANGYVFNGVVLTESAGENGGQQYTLEILRTNAENIALKRTGCVDKNFVQKNCCENIEESTKDGILVMNNDLFQQSMTYSGIDISRIEYSNNCIIGRVRNNYSYDGDHRLKTVRNSIFHPVQGTISGAYNANYAYKINGDIESIGRHGLTDISTGAHEQIDSLVYSYNGLQLANVNDVSNHDYGYLGNPIVSGDYDYDANGNMVLMPYKGISSPMEYGINNLPLSVNIQNVNLLFDYAYGSTQLKKDNGIDVRDYLGAMEFKNGSPEFLSHSSGRILLSSDGNDYQWSIADHLGNTVVVFEDKNNDGIIEDEVSASEGLLELEVIQRNSYYSFGMEQIGMNSSPTLPEFNYTYNGKELHKDGGLNWQNFGFRFYDPSIARFTGVDPLAEKFAHVSVYNYAENKPIAHIDLWGLQAEWSITGLYNSPGIEGESEEFIKENPKTAAVIAVAMIGGPFALAAALEAGPAITISFVANEFKDEILSQLTYGASDAIDISKQVKNLIQLGGKFYTKNLDEIKASYDEAGYTIVDSNHGNVTYEVPKEDGTGTFYSRLQKGTKSSGNDPYKGDRIINTRNTGNTFNKDYVNPDGSRIEGAVSKDERKEIGHIHLTKTEIE